MIEGPAALAWELCEKHGLEKDQRKAVALVVVKLARAWQKALRQTPELRSSNSDIWKKHDGSKALLPLYGVQSRVVLIGSGGAGKTTIINFVLTPVLEEYYGRDGLQKEAPSNKAARGINGVTVHVANNLRGNSSLLTPHLRQKPRQTACVRRQGRQGARVYDEFSQ